MDEQVPAHGILGVQVHGRLRDEQFREKGKILCTVIQSAPKQAQGIGPLLNCGVGIGGGFPRCFEHFRGARDGLFDRRVALFCQFG